MKPRSAIILAAGLGTRLKPLTLTTPKPLLPLNGTLLIDHQINYLASYGIEDIAINLYHLGSMIKDHCGEGSRYGVKISYSEEIQILGTGGGVKRAAQFVKNMPIVVLNCDAMVFADLGALFEAHISSASAATMVVMKNPPNSGFNPVEVSGDAITGFGRGDGLFTGLHVIGQGMLDALPRLGVPACIIKDGYEKILSAGGKIAAFQYEGYWNDLGTPSRYEAAKKAVAEGEVFLAK